MAPRTLLLLLAVALAPTQTRAGSHLLTDFSNAASRHGLGEPGFTVFGYPNDTQFACFHRDAETRRLESGALQVEQEKPEYWERETQNVNSEEQTFGVDMRALFGYFNQSECGLHTIERMYGCDVGSGRSFCQYEQLAYEGP